MNSCNVATSKLGTENPTDSSLTNEYWAPTMCQVLDGKVEEIETCGNFYPSTKALFKVNGLIVNPDYI